MSDPTDVLIDNNPINDVPNGPMASLDIVFSPKIAKPADVTNDELTGDYSLLRKIAEDLSEIKRDISEIKRDTSEMKNEILETKNCNSSTYDTVKQLEGRVETIEHVTTSINSHLQRRKTKLSSTPPEPFQNPSEPAQSPSEPSQSPSEPSQSPAEPSQDQPLIFFTTLLTSSMFLNDTTESEPPPPPQQQQQPETTTSETEASSSFALNSVASTPITAKSKRTINALSTFIRQQMTNYYDEKELANGSLKGGKRKYKSDVIEKVTLSPNRWGKIMVAARRKYPKEDFDSINLNEVANGKCRQVKFKLEKRFKSC